MAMDSSLILLEIIGFLKSFQNHPLLRQLPNGSWQAAASSEPGTLYISIIRNDHLLKEHNWHEITDPTEWLYVFVPPISRFLAARRQMIPEGFKVTFSAKSESDDWRASSPAMDLVAAAETGEIAQFGRMMAMLELDVTHN